MSFHGSCGTRAGGSEALVSVERESQQFLPPDAANVPRLAGHISLLFTRLPNPDVAETHGVVVILQFKEDLGRMGHAVF